MSCRRSTARFPASGLRDFLKRAASLGIALMVVAAASGSRADVVVEAREPAPDELAPASAHPARRLRAD